MSAPQTPLTTNLQRRPLTPQQAPILAGVPGLFSLPFLTQQLTALQSGVDSFIQCDKDFDFRVSRIVATSTGIFSVFLQDSSRGLPLLEWFQNPVFGENIAGPASQPYWLQKKLLIRAGTRLTATFADRSNAANTIQFTLVGKKVLPQ